MKKTRLSNEDVLNRIQGRLIVSCQALPHEPLHSSYIMSRMAAAALEGGASGIRANTAADIRAIRETVDLPVIGIIKQVYEGFDVFITPTLKEIGALAEEGCEIIAFDATNRPRPDGKTLDELFSEARAIYPEQLFMADCSTVEDGLHAAALGFDLIGTTLSGYTADTAGAKLPNIDLVRELALRCGKPVIAEGGIHTPEELRSALDAGAFAAVVGGAITRPQEITKRFVSVVER